MKTLVVGITITMTFWFVPNNLFSIVHVIHHQYMMNTVYDDKFVLYVSMVIIFTEKWMHVVRNFKNQNLAQVSISSGIHSSCVKKRAQKEQKTNAIKVWATCLQILTMGEWWWIIRQEWALLNLETTCYKGKCFFLSWWNFKGDIEGQNWAFHPYFKVPSLEWAGLGFQWWRVYSYVLIYSSTFDLNFWFMVYLCYQN